jgi:hypothetical protein
MIRVLLTGALLPLRFEGDALGATEAITQDTTGHDLAIVRMDTDEEFIAFRDAMSSALAARLASARLLASTLDGWTSDLILTDGPGWRSVVSRKPIQVPQTRAANGAAVRR